MVGVAIGVFVLETGVFVLVGTGVLVGVAVAPVTGVYVLVGHWVRVGVGVAVLTGVSVGMGVIVGVGVGATQIWLEITHVRLSNSRVNSPVKQPWEVMLAGQFSKSASHQLSVFPGSSILGAAAGTGEL